MYIYNCVQFILFVWRVAPLYTLANMYYIVQANSMTNKNWNQLRTIKQWTKQFNMCVSCTLRYGRGTDGWGLFISSFPYYFLFLQRCKCISSEKGEGFSPACKTEIVHSNIVHCKRDGQTERERQREKESCCTHGLYNPYYYPFFLCNAVVVVAAGICFVSSVEQFAICHSTNEFIAQWSSELLWRRQRRATLNCAAYFLFMCVRGNRGLRTENVRNIYFMFSFDNRHWK